MNSSDSLTSTIIGCAYKVHNNLGYGFLEKVYEKALLIELEDSGLTIESQKPLQIFYKGQNIGDYFADIVVNSEIIIELKSTASLLPEHSAQLINYLKATDLKVGLLINFAPRKPEVKRCYNKTC